MIAANAGGAWTPIGDVTTTMLWIGGQITSLEIMKGLVLPSLVNLVVPLDVTGYFLGNRQVVAPPRRGHEEGADTSAFERQLMFFLGLGILMAVPGFKTVTHLPPFFGILFGVGILWAVGDLVHRKQEELKKQRLTLARALTRIDMASIIFFIGILMAVAVLEHVHILSSIAQWLDQTVGSQAVIVMLIGLVSAVVDNVPLVAASTGMYTLAQYPTASFPWEFMAYCAGTGGSILIIGSAAGVAAMGLEKIDFVWYLRKISALAPLGYVAGAAVYIVQYQALH